jgi:hypothetical protein
MRVTTSRPLGGLLLFPVGTRPWVETLKARKLHQPSTSHVARAKAPALTVPCQNSSTPPHLPLPPPTALPLRMHPTRMVPAAPKWMEPPLILCT